MWMNEYDIDNAIERHAAHPILGPATKTLGHLMEWTNQNSDGWPYWRKPANAAKKLMEMINRDGTFKYCFGAREDVTVAEYRKALAPIKAFRTRQGADFEVIEI